MNAFRTIKALSMYIYNKRIFAFPVEFNETIYNRRIDIFETENQLNGNVAFCCVFATAFTKNSNESQSSNKFHA